MRVGDFELDVQIGDGKRLVDRERGCSRRVVRDALWHVAGNIPLDEWIVQRELTDVGRAGNAVRIVDRAFRERVGHRPLAG